jgi:REP element-mobilizing transposase RayT
MGRTLAIHWAQTTHGTWLHGNPRGSWENGRLIGPDPYLEAACRASMSNDAILLDETERELVAGEFGKIVREHGYGILAATIQATHVHLVFGPLNEDIKKVISRFKYRSSVAVLRHRRNVHSMTRPAGTAGLYSRAVSARSVPKSLWTAGRFPVFIFNDLHLGNAVEYVRDHNRQIGLAADPYDWIDPLYRAGKLAGERLYRSTVHEVLPW